MNEEEKSWGKIWVTICCTPFLCHMSCVTCYLSPVKCHIYTFLLYFSLIKNTLRGRRGGGARPIWKKAYILNFWDTFLTGKNDFRPKIKACFRKTIIHFFYSQNQGKQHSVFFYRINLAIDLNCYIPDSHVLCS